MNRDERVNELYRSRPRNRFARTSFLVLGLVIAASFTLGWSGSSGATSARRMKNLERFLGEIVPFSARGSDRPVVESARWAYRLLDRRGFEASLQTMSIAVAAIVLAGAVGAALAFGAARNLASPEPFAPDRASSGAPVRWLWKSLVGAVRLGLIFARAIPEYIWAFLFLAILGPSAWPAVLALALHNAGILGKLGAETIENVEPEAPTALRDLGATRRQIALVGLFPIVMPRFLLYFFYRWETCVREATVLGLLGFASLGYWIQDARARDHYDEMIFYILLGSALVLAGDIVSALTRLYLRKAS